MLHREDHDHVRRLTWDRPDRRNAFDTAQYLRLADALDEARVDDSVHVVVLTGTGTAFSAGQDLDEMEQLARHADAGSGIESGFPRLIDALAAFDKPLVAAVNGVAVGVGFTLLAYCDAVLAVPDARFRAPFAPMGVPPEAASSYLLPMRMGWLRAAHVLLTGEWIDAEEAKASGVVSRIVTGDRLLDEALGEAHTIARSPLSALRAIKGAMLAGQADAISAARAREDAAFAELLAGFTRPV